MKSTIDGKRGQKAVRWGGGGGCRCVYFVCMHPFTGLAF